MGVDLVRHLVEMTPLLAELRRLMSRSQEIETLPLDVVDNAAPIEAAMQANGDEPRLARHEPGPLGHQGQCFRLLVGFRFDDRDLGDGLLVGLDLWHEGPRLIGWRMAISPRRSTLPR